MKIFAPALLLGCALLAPRGLAADTALDPKLQALQKSVASALGKRAAAPRRGGNSTPDETTSAAANAAYPREQRDATANRVLAQLFLRGTDSSVQQLEQQLAELAAATENDPDVLSAATALREASRAAQSARAGKARDELDVLLTKAGQTCLAATKPEDLDDLIKTLAPYSRDNGGNPYPARGGRGAVFTATPDNAQRASQAYRFVTLWQDYLALRPKDDAEPLAPQDSNRLNNTISELRNLADIVGVAHSRILALRPADSGATPTARSGARGSSPAPGGRGGRGGRGAGPAPGL